ncbi:MAG: hypothetical protein ACF8Q5_14690 [Phycisphaerales bacterium JB040]
MRFPVDDWQFWVATAGALLALAWIARGLWRVVRPKARSTRTRVTLTVDRERVRTRGRTD